MIFEWMMVELNRECFISYIKDFWTSSDGWSVLIDFHLKYEDILFAVRRVRNEMIRKFRNENFILLFTELSNSILP